MILFSNNATTTIAGAISPTSVQVNIAAGAGVLFPSPTGGDYFICTLYKNDTSGLFEIVHCTQRVVDTLTIVRGQEGTSPQQWNPGDSLSNLITAGGMGEFLQQSERGIEEAPLDGRPYARQSATWTNTPFAAPPTPVWPPVGWATSSWVYTGHDTGTKNALVVPIVTPDMTALAEGTLITVKVAQTNDGPSTLKVKNFPAYPVVKMNGEQISGAQLTAANDMVFWFDGSKWVVPVQPAEQAEIPGGDTPIDTELPWHFHCDCDNGIDDILIRDGLSPQKAWRTLAKAIEFIEHFYATRPKVHIHCGHGAGSYGHFEIISPHVAEWEIEGDDFDPLSCHLHVPDDAGCRFSNCKVTLHGFHFDTRDHNVVCDIGCNVIVRDCYLHHPPAPPKGDGHRPAIICQGGGLIILGGNLNFRAKDASPCDVIEVVGGGTCHWGHEPDLRCDFNFENDCHFEHGPVWCHANSFLSCWHDGCTWTNPHLAHGPKFWCETGSGFDGCKGDKDWWPGDMPGWCDEASFSYYR